ncbi:MAG: glycoside hydrolase family 95 protein [Opitutales bacterium]
MYRKSIFSAAFIGLSASLLSNPSEQTDALKSGHIIWDQAGAGKDWELSYPVGNGRLGAAVFGNFPTERIVLNEDSIWEKLPREQMPENSREIFEEILELDKQGEWEDAKNLFIRSFQVPRGQPAARPSSYQLVGSLLIAHDAEKGAKAEITRWLDLSKATAYTESSLAGETISQSVYASYPDDVIVIKLASDQAAGLSFNASVNTKLITGTSLLGNDLIVNGKGSGDGTTYQARLRFKLEGGSLSESGTGVRIEGADSVIIKVAIETDFNRDDVDSPLADGWQAGTLATLDALAKKPEDKIHADAVADYQTYFNRASINLGNSSDDVLKMSTPDRLQRIKDGATDDHDLVETYFNFGRLLLISSSRPGSLPANLQGVWNPFVKAPWSSDYHLNINLQMNYWHAETTNLSEFHKPLFDLIHLYQPFGKNMAQEMGFDGWVMPHASDLWGRTRIWARKAANAASFFGGQWLVQHIMEHYRFNRDAEYLATHWDVMVESTKFVMEWMYWDEDIEQWVSRPTASPENQFQYKDASGKNQKGSVSSGNSFDQYMMMQSLDDLIEAAEILGKTDEAIVKEAKKRLPKIYRPEIDEDGRLKEWRQDSIFELKPDHRHISHVIGSYPGNQIDLDADLAMRDAVSKSVYARLANGGAATGWSRAWTIGMLARMSDSKGAFENLIALFQVSTTSALWDTHPPLQIDGNFGATAAITEMLLHSHGETEDGINIIRFLPALPDSWHTGSFDGLKARGGFEIDLEWKDGEATQARILGKPGSTFVLVNNSAKPVELKIPSNGSLVWNP